jgi:saccharopine dehydrogenase (NAD+, L-lysine-forming)
MSKVIIIGAGGVGGVVTHKCAQLPEVFPEIILASRNEEKCKKIAAQLSRPIRTAQVDADNVAELTALLEKEKPSLVINVALPYQDLHIMDACLNAGVHYLDTANYEPPEVAKFEYKWQWAYQEKFQKAGLMALLGSGFDPGVTNVYTAYIKKHCLDEIHELDIIVREVTAKGRFWQNGEWVETDPLSVKDSFEFPEGIGPMDIYLMYHEELESIVKHFPEIKRARFWMTFSQNYLKHLEVLQNVGMTGIKPVMYNGVEVIPLQFLKSVLPDPSSLGPLTKGRTCIGCVAKGIKDGKEKIVYIYNICDHEACFREVQSQAISYTTGVPAMIGAKMMLENKWMKPGVWNMEQFDPDPFMEDLNKYGLPWTLVDLSDTGLAT